MENTSLLPAWLVLPMAVVVLLVLGGQFWALAALSMDEHRRRLRQASTFVMMLLTPLAAYAFAIATPARGREYVIVWGLVAVLLMIVMFLAVIDMLHSLRLYRVQAARVRREIAEERAREVAAALLLAKAEKAKSGQRDA
jgi:hypothetical protein